MIKEIKKHWKEVLFLILGVPIIFISITYFLFDILPGNKIIEKNNWISFAGSYLGIMGAVGAVWWQMKVERQKLINEKKEKEKDEILNLLNELTFLSSKGKIENEINAIQTMFSFHFYEHSNERQYNIIRGNWTKILEEDRKILFSKKMESFYYKNIHDINETNKEYFIFLNEKSFIKNIYGMLYKSEELNDDEKKIIEFFSLNIGIETDNNPETLRKYKCTENNISKYLKNIRIIDWTKIIEDYNLGKINNFNKIKTFLNLLEPFYAYVVSQDNTLKDNLLEKEKPFELSIDYLKTFNEKILSTEKKLKRINKEAILLRKKIEKNQND